MVEDRFIELLTKKLTDEIDQIELQELASFLDNNEDCRTQYDFFTQYWMEDEEQYPDSNLMFQKIRSKIGVSEEIDIVMTESINSNSFSSIWIAIAAMLAVAIGCGLFYYHYMQVNAPSQHLLSTETASRCKLVVTLSDGSKVELNSETVLRYPAAFTGNTREVYLSGEAFFNVAKDHKHPFIVHAGKMNIRVLGTTFNVKSYKNDAQSETTLIKGAIEVTLADRPSDRIILKPHDKLILKTKTIKALNKFAKHSSVNTDSISTNYALTSLTYLKSNDTTVVETSWVSNRLVFKDEAFDVLANQMERWYGVKVIFENNDAKNYHFTGVFEKENVLQAFDALKLVENFKYKYKNQTFYIN